MNAHEMITDITGRAAVAGDDLLLHELDGWDSLKGVRLVVALEEAIGRQLSEAELERLQSVGDVERVLRGGS
jgi:acyl carrier protein